MADVQQNNNNNHRQQHNNNNNNHRQQNNNNNNNNNRAQKDHRTNQTTRREPAVLKPSVNPQNGWRKLEQKTINFATFTTLSLSVPEPEDLAFCGSLEHYDRTCDRITPRYARKLDCFDNKTFYKVSTSDDPILVRLAAEDKGTVFATDAILSTLMCASKSVYGWDVGVWKEGNKLYFDKSKEGSVLDMVPVHETSQVSLPNDNTDINSAYFLSVEATNINLNFSQQVLVKGGNKVACDKPDPFTTEGQDVASVGYRYRRWNLGNGVSLVSRCELHAVSDVNDNRQYLTVNALNEIDPKYSGLDWRQKLETQRGAVMANEMSNNANKFARWTTQALLAGADTMKVGLVSRAHLTENTSHVILGVVGYKPKDFASQISLNMPNKWGVLKRIIDLCMKLNDGEYVLVKDPKFPQIIIYQLPKNN